MSETPGAATATHANAAQTDGETHGGIDLQVLANKVYDLLLADARLGRARSDSPLISRRHGEG
jgi:hypothetical protein